MTSGETPISSPTLYHQQVSKVLIFFCGLRKKKKEKVLRMPVFDDSWGRVDNCPIHVKQKA